MPTLSLVSGGVAALVGALVWGFIGAKANVEVGYIAWGIGVLVGLAAVRCGARGSTPGVVFGAIALLSIAGGKLMAIEFAFNDRVDSTLTEGAFEAEQREAEELKKLTDEELPAFMVNNGYTDKSRPREVTREEIDAFKEYRGTIEAVADMTYDEWKEQRSAFAQAFLAAKRTDAFMESLSPFDLLWVFLGVGSAFKIVAAAGHGGTTARKDGPGEAAA